MEIKGLHRNIYRLYRYARTQECLEKYRQLYQTSVDKWEEAKRNGGTDAFAKKYAGISRATYFRRKKILNALHKGITPPSKRPKKFHKPRWGEAEKQLVLKIRHENPTYGKEKSHYLKARSRANYDPKHR